MLHGQNVCGLANIWKVQQDIMNNRNDISTIQNDISRIQQDISGFKQNFAEIKQGLTFIYGKSIMNNAIKQNLN